VSTATVEVQRDIGATGLSLKLQPNPSALVIDYHDLTALENLKFGHYPENREVKKLTPS
jgi:hypothetical protein